MTRQYTNKAMRSFFGARPGGQDRPQNIDSPLWLIQAINELWPEGITLDPCSSTTTKVRAKRYCYGSYGDSGIDLYWPNFTYANPPYNKLKDWLAKPVPGREHLMLAPCRPNRRWYCEAIGTFPVTCFMRPFAFDGHKQSYPTPIGLSYWGTRLKEFKRIFSQYGIVGRLLIEI